MPDPFIGWQRRGISAAQSPHLSIRSLHPCCSTDAINTLLLLTQTLQHGTQVVNIKLLLQASERQTISGGMKCKRHSHNPPR